MSEQAHKKIEEFIRKITGDMGIVCEISIAPAADAAMPTTISLQAPESAKLLIGKNGQNLQALEHVVRAMLARQESLPGSITIDVNDYRKTKVTQLIDIVHQTADRVRDSRRPETLPVMTSYERRIVHTELAAYSDLATESVGREPQRRVVIRPL